MKFIVMNQGQNIALSSSVKNAIIQYRNYNNYEEFVEEFREDFRGIEIKNSLWILPMSVYDNPIFSQLKGYVNSNGITIRDVLQSEFIEYEI